MARPGLWANLSTSNDAVVAANLSWGKVAMTRPGVLADLVTSALAQGDRSVALQPLKAAGENLEVIIPTAVLKEKFEDVLSQIQLFGALPEETAGFSTDVGKTRNNVLGMVALDLRTPRGDLNVSDLKEPIEFSMPVMYQPGLKCFFWDMLLKQWSNDGVEVSNRSALGGPLRCVTYHLSLFGAILQGIISTLLCSNFALLSPEAFAELGKGTWYQSTSALLCWGLLAVLFFFFLAACLVDDWRARSWGWKNEFLLVEAMATETTGDDEETGSEDGAPEKASKGKLCAVCALISASCSAAASCLCGSSAFREALDDISESWCEWFSQWRGILESVCEGLEANCTCVSSSVIMKSATHLLFVSSRRMTVSATGLSEDAVSCVLENEDLAAFLMDEHVKLVRQEREDKKARKAAGIPETKGASGSSRSVGDWQKQPTQTAAWKTLHEEVSDYILRHVHHTSRMSLRAMGMILLSNNPIGALYLFDFFISCKQRVLLFAADLMGALALSCLFFQASGLVRGKPRGDSAGCGGDDDGGMGGKIGRFIVIASGSLLFAGLPVIILESLLTKDIKVIPGGQGSAAWNKQLRAWQVQERLFWLIGFLYLSFCTLFVIVFLANIGNEDNEDWFTSGGMALLEDIVMLPVGMAIILPLMARSLLLVYACITKKDMHHLVRHACEQMHQSTNLMLPITQA